MAFDELYREAKAVIYSRKLSEYASAGGVAAAILSESGKIHTGVFALGVMCRAYCGCNHDKAR